MSVSSAVLAANQRLLALRQQRGQRQTAVSPQPALTSQTAVSLPAHLGWGSARLTQTIRRANNKQTPIDATDTDAQPGGQSSLVIVPNDPAADPQTDILTTVRHYPSLGVGALRETAVPHYQVWLACRLLDSAGRGWLNSRFVRDELSGKGAPLRLFGWRRLRQVLQGGNGRFWRWDKQQHRIWLFSAARVGKSLNVAKLTGTPIWLPSHALTQGIGTFKAHLYAAWHSGRKTNRPISREALRQLTHIPERTQRLYEKQTRVGVRPNLAVGAAYTPENVEKHSWQRGGAVFKFIDKQGRFGRKHDVYLAWQLPNSYTGPHQQAATGRQTRINHHLTDLVHEGAQGNGEPVKMCQRYFEDGKAAAQAINRQSEKETFWPQGALSSYDVWAFFYIQ